MYNDPFKTPVVELGVVEMFRLSPVIEVVVVA